MDKATIRHIKRRLALAESDPVLYALTSMEWHDGYDVGGGYWQSQCPACDGMPKSKLKNISPAMRKKFAGHKRKCWLRRAIRVQKQASKEVAVLRDKLATAKRELQAEFERQAGAAV